MNINNNIHPQNRTPSFGSIKIVKCKNEDIVGLVEHCGTILGIQQREIFKAKSFLHHDLIKHVELQAKRMGYSKEWLVQNAERHGITIPQTDSEPYYDITGKELKNFHKLRIKSLLKMIFYLFKHRNNKDVQALPGHLQFIKIMSDFADKQQGQFDKFLEKNGAKEIDLPHYVSSLFAEFLFHK